MRMLHSYKTYNFKIFPFLLHGYHTPQLKNIAFPAIAFLSHNFKILPNWNFLGLVVPLNFFERYVEIVSIIITIF